MTNLEMFSPTIINFQREVNRNPNLVQFIRDDETVDISNLYEVIAVVAGYYNILVDGYYSEQDMLDLADILVNRMYNERAQSSKIIIP